MIVVLVLQEQEWEREHGIRYGGAPSSTVSGSRDVDHVNMPSSTQALSDVHQSPQGVTPAKSPASLAPDEREILRVGHVDSSQSPADRMMVSQSGIADRRSPNVATYHKDVTSPANSKCFLLYTSY